MKLNFSSQTFKIYKDDKKYSEVLEKVKKNQFDPFVQDFKDTLPDGTYLLYNINRKEVKKENQSILIKGSYKNHLRHGTFEYYNLYSKESNPKPFLILNYKFGELSGSCCKNSAGEKEMSFYQSGVLHGFYYVYDKNENIKKISLYENGELKYWSNMSEQRVLDLGVIRREFGTKEYYSYDENETVVYKFIYRNNDLTQICEYYPNGKIMTVREGEFQKLATDMVFPVGVLAKTPLLFGSIIEYDESGKIIKEIKKDK